MDIAAPWTVALTDGQHSLIQYAVVVTGFALAAMLTRMWSARREVSDRYRPAVHAGVAVCTVALLSYVLLAFELQTGYRPAAGMWVPTASASTTWSARYMDWTISVPLLVVEIVAVSALIGRAAARARWVGGTAAVLMVVLGFLGAVVIGGGTDFRVLLWLGIASSACFAVVYAVVIAVVLRSLPVLPAAARGPLTAAMVVLLVVWLVYPVVYGLQGLASGGAWTTTQHLLFCAADVVAKVVFGLLLLRVARLRTAADVVAQDDAHPESIWVDQLRQSR
ncbi:bacteriorhodopsin [uncultured Amnibacterium sp.]|uniref:bacteriorhodopsin n=1 Tax=uncultured Amnibacterium sp. TaxID=1631851 RepID=UPI0035CA59DA